LEIKPARVSANKQAGAGRPFLRAASEAVRGGSGSLGNDAERKAAEHQRGNKRLCELGRHDLSPWFATSPVMPIPGKWIDDGAAPLNTGLEK
jgi:hypothetical protein